MKNLGQDWFTARFYQTFKCNQTSIRLKVFHKTEEKIIVPNLFYEFALFRWKKKQKQKPKNWKDLTKKENYKITFPMNILNVILIKKKDFKNTW